MEEDVLLFNTSMKNKLNVLNIMLDEIRIYSNDDCSMNSNYIRVITDFIYQGVEIYNSIGREDLALFLLEDFENWRDKGIDTIPYFNVMANNFSSSGDEKLDFFLGPMRCPNSNDENKYNWQYFLSYHTNPLKNHTTFLNVWKHKKPLGQVCQPSLLLSGSSTVYQGNCLVFFPENILSCKKIRKQNFAIFFFNKFYKIYRNITVKNTKHLVNKDLQTNYSEEVSYLARSVWGYLHDYYHHNGVRPLDSNLHLKINWFAGVLEELKVDLQSYLACYEYNNTIPHASIVSEMILYERLFRYSSQHDAIRNFDSASGFLLFEWLVENNCIKITSNTIQILEEEIVFAIQKLVNSIEMIESIENDQKFLDESKKFVRKYLPADPSEHNKYTLPYHSDILLQAIKK